MPYSDKMQALKVILSNGINEIAEKSSRFTILMSGVVIKVRQRVGAKGRFAFLSLVDTCGSYEIAIFNDQLISDKRELFQEGKSLIVKVDCRNDPQGGLKMNGRDLYDAFDVFDNKIPLQDLFDRVSEGSKSNSQRATKKVSNSSYNNKNSEGSASNSVKAVATVKASSSVKPGNVAKAIEPQSK